MAMRFIYILCIIMLAMSSGAEIHTMFTIGGDQNETARFIEGLQKWQGVSHGDVVATCRDTVFAELLPPAPSNQIRIFLSVGNIISTRQFIPDRAEYRTLLRSTTDSHRTQRLETTDKAEFISQLRAGYRKEQIINEDLRKSKRSGENKVVSEHSLLLADKFAAKVLEDNESTKTEVKLNEARHSSRHKETGTQSRNEQARKKESLAFEKASTKKTKATIAVDQDESKVDIDVAQGKQEQIDEATFVEHTDKDSSKSEIDTATTVGAQKNEADANLDEKAIGVAGERRISIAKRNILESTKVRSDIAKSMYERSQANIGLQAFSLQSDKFSGSERVVRSFKLRISADKDHVSLGEEVRIEIAFTNVGEKDVKDPEIAFSLPRGLSIEQYQRQGSNIQSVDAGNKNTKQLICWHLKGLYNPMDSEDLWVIIKFSETRHSKKKDLFDTELTL